MSIVTYADFTGQESIAGLSNQGIRQSLQLFIDTYEPLFLESLLGELLYKDYVTGLVPVEVSPATDPVTFLPIDPKWVFIRDNPEIKQALVCFIYYWYLQDGTTLTSSTGEVKAQNENSYAASNWDKMVKAWNKMVKLTRSFTLPAQTYPGYQAYHRQSFTYWWDDCPVNEIFYFKNTLNL